MQVGRANRQGSASEVHPTVAQSSPPLLSFLAIGKLSTGQRKRTHAQGGYFALAADDQSARAMPQNAAPLQHLEPAGEDAGTAELYPATANAPYSRRIAWWAWISAR
jgi:hypothetical protein